MGMDTIGGFPLVSDLCQGCGKRLEVENAWMTDGCPCNTALGVNNLNETRWRFLMQLQQEQSREIERLKAELAQAGGALEAHRLFHATVACPGIPKCYVCQVEG